MKMRTWLWLLLGSILALSAPPVTNYTLTISVYGNGTVSSSPAGIVNCSAVGGNCSALFASGTSVTLTAVGAAGSTLTGWAFPGCGITGTCTPSVIENTSVTVVFTTNVPELPRVWVNPYEAFDPSITTLYELDLGASQGVWIGSSPALCSGMFTLANYTSTFAGLQAAHADLEACRTHIGVVTPGAVATFTEGVPAGTYPATNVNGWVLQQTSASTSSSFLAIKSLDLSFLPPGRPVCTHGIQKNVPSAKHPGIHNPTCDGKNMYDDTGATISGGVVSNLTTYSVSTTILCPIPNSTATTLCPVTTLGTQQVVPLFNGYVQDGLPIVLDAGGTTEPLTTAAGVNQIGMIVTPQQSHTAGCNLVVVGSNNVWTGCTATVTYDVGSFTLKNGTVVHTSDYNDAAHFFKVVAQSGNSSAVTYCNASGTGQVPTCGTNFGPDHTVIQGMEASLSPGSTGTGFIVQMQGPGFVTSTGQLATHNGIQRSWLHGDWASPYVGANNVSGACDLEGLGVYVVDSHISMIMRPGNESHPCTVQSDQGMFYDNWLDSGSQGFFSGGYSNGSGPTLAGWLSFCDIEERDNRLTHPFAWLGLSPVLAGINPHFANNYSITEKNLQENKEFCRVVFEGNVIDGIDNSGAQLGVESEMNPRNNSSGVGTHYNAAGHDMTAQFNLYSDGCTLLNITTSNAGPGGGVAYAPRNILLHGNFWYGISINNFGCSSQAGVQLNSGGGSWQGRITQTDSNHKQFIANCNVDTGDCKGQVNGVTVNAGGGNCVGSPTLGFSAPDLAGGTQARGTVHCSGTAYQTPNISVFGSGYVNPPTVTLTCAGCTGSPSASATINAASSNAVGTDTGFQVFNILAGDPVPISQCQTSSFNTVPTTLHSATYIPSAIGPPASGPSTPWGGSFVTGNVTVTVPSTGTPGATENSDYCKLTTLQGAPYFVDWDHNTVVSDSTNVINSSQAFGNSDTDGPQYMILAAVRNSLFMNGGIGSGPVGTGTVAQQFWFDSVNTLTMDHTAFTNQLITSYTAYGANPIYPAASPVLYFPSNTCGIGFVGTGAWAFGTCSGNAVPLMTPDYHSYALAPGPTGSVFAAGNTQQALDGTDAGACLSCIDAAETQIQYRCMSPCGSPGPFTGVPNPTVIGPPVGMIARVASRKVSHGTQAAERRAAAGVRVEDRAADAKQCATCRWADSGGHRRGRLGTEARLHRARSGNAGYGTARPEFTDGSVRPISQGERLETGTMVSVEWFHEAPDP